MSVADSPSGLNGRIDEAHQTIAGEFRVNEVHEDIRAVSRLYHGFPGTGQRIPSEGLFTVRFELDEHGDPHIEILSYRH